MGIAGGDVYGERKAVQVPLLSIYKNDNERQEGYKTDGQQADKILQGLSAKVYTEEPKTKSVKQKWPWIS